MPNRIRLNIDHVQDTLWAVKDGKFDEINAVITSILEGTTPPFRDEYLSIGQPKIDAAAQVLKPYQITKTGKSFSSARVATIPISGTIMKKASLFSDFSGGCSSQKVMGAIRFALADKDVDVIALDIDSPGGAVEGVKTLADFIFESRIIKPIVAFSDGSIASAAYWIASACESIYTCATSISGSIGVRLSHYDLSGRDKANGVVRTTIFAGKYKAIADDTGPLSKDGREYLQDLVDKTYATFLADVARNRGVSHEAALAMAEGRVFIGEEAVKVGLIDGIGLLDAAIGRTAYAKGKRMTEEELKAQLEEANAKLAAMETEKIAADLAAQAARAEALADKARAADLEKEVLRKGIENKIASLVSEGKVAPAMVDAGLVDFVAALDGLGEISLKGEKVQARDWFVAQCLESKPIIAINEQVASESTVAAVTGKEAEIKAGLEIAKCVNPELN
ncbi:MAG: S49 family peptidase [Syntrophobacteraceae bacterium]